jgi:glutathionylspermidine synthase
MTQLGLTEAEQKLAMIDPGFTGAGITTRLDGFIHGREIKFVEYNAENPSSLSDQEGLNRLQWELPSLSMLAQRYHLQQFSAVENDSVVVRYGTKEAQ